MTLRDRSIRALGMMASCVALASCASGAQATLDNRFQAIGIPPETAGCMAGRLSDDLSGAELQELAQYTVNVSRADTALDAIQSLREFDNPRAAAAIGRAGVACVTGLGGRR